MKTAALFSFALASFVAAQSVVPTNINPNCPNIPTSENFPSTTALNDPFTTLSGQKVTTKAQWECRKNEIHQLFQLTHFGVMPPKPQSVTASMSGNNLSITVRDNNQSINFSVSISRPSGQGPFPAIIALGFPTIPIPSGVATITFNNDDIGAQQNTGSRGRGKFYTLYGQNHSASAMMAWAWGVSRIIDALELTPGANIDPKRVGIVGCSRNGKGAYIAGAFEPRIALTIPQESGSGGAACWRLSDEQKRRGQNVQTAQQIITENVWLSKGFEKYVNRVPTLPVDHHLLAALVEPRGLYIAENGGMEWLGAMSTYGCSVAGKKIYEALGIPENMGYSQISGHNHCSFPSGQNAELTAFINKFLRNQSGQNTNILRTTSNNLNFNQNTWIPWSTPNLS